MLPTILRRDDMAVGSMPRSDYRLSPERIGDRGSGPAMTARGGSVSLRKEAITTEAVCGNAKD